MTAGNAIISLVLRRAETSDRLSGDFFSVLLELDRQSGRHPAGPFDLEAVEIDSTRTIDIERFVPRSEIDELYKVRGPIG